MVASVPPRFVPTLTDVVFGTQDAQTASVVCQSQGQIEEQIVHRIMQRVDLVIERRLREAVGQVILAHTQTLAPKLREEIELVVLESVIQAVSQELPGQSS